MTITGSPTTAQPPARALDELRDAVAGRLVTPADPDWDRLRSPWAVTVDQRPLAVLKVSGAADVQAAVRWAVEHRVQVTAQPVGHGAVDAMEGVLLLRTRPSTRSRSRAGARRVTVGAGVKAGELLRRPRGHRPHLPPRAANPDPVRRRHDDHRRD